LTQDAHPSPSYTTSPRNEPPHPNTPLPSPPDPLPIYTAAGFEYRFSCDDGTTWSAWSSTSSASCSTNDNGTRHVKGELRDKDGGDRKSTRDDSSNRTASYAAFNMNDTSNESSDINLSL